MSEAILVTITRLGLTKNVLKGLVFAGIDLFDGHLADLVE